MSNYRPMNSLAGSVCPWNVVQRHDWRLYKYKVRPAAPCDWSRVSMKSDIERESDANNPMDLRKHRPCFASSHFSILNSKGSELCDKDVGKQTSV